MCELGEAEMFYDKNDSIVNQCSSLVTLIFLCDFNTMTGTQRAGYEQ